MDMIEATMKELSDELFRGIMEGNMKKEDYISIYKKMKNIEKTAANKGFLQFFYGDIARVAMHSELYREARAYAGGYMEICKKTNDKEGIKQANLLMSDMFCFAKDFKRGLKYYTKAHQNKCVNKEIVNLMESKESDPEQKKFYETDERPKGFERVLSDSLIYSGQKTKEIVANQLGIRVQSLNQDYIR